MNEVELINKNSEITLEDLPDVIKTQVDKMNILENQIKECDSKAKQALAAANNLEGYRVGNWGFRHGDTKSMVTDLQAAVKEIANSQGVSVEALTHIIDLQKQLAKISEVLFYLGCSNIAANRVAVRTIELKLQNASEEKISELAQQELRSVVKQLKDQEDLLQKQENLTKKVRENREFISDINDKLDNKDKIDDEQTQRLDEFKALLDNKDIIDEKQEEAIRSLLEDKKLKEKIDLEQTEKLNSLQKLLNSKEELDKKLEEEIKILFDYMKTKDALDEEQSNNIEKALKGNKKRSLFINIAIGITFAISVVNTILILLK